MTPAGSILREEILHGGPISFHRFMNIALYHPEVGYYTGARDPFGAQGDYYTAEQIQPVFGILIASCFRALCEELNLDPEPTVVELGPGRREMAPYLAGFRYVPVDIGDELPPTIRGIVFANEFFDALPVHVVIRRNDEFHEMRVGLAGDRFYWVEGELVSGPVAEYLIRHAAPIGEGDLLEVPLDALQWIDRIAARLEKGFLLVVDYGYTAAEVLRFPQGTLMSYQRHLASDEVLADPGGRDITAHICFSALADHAVERGLDRVRLESLAHLLLRAGERDQFAAALSAVSEEKRIKRRLQLKTLLFGMGETFRSLLLRRA